MFLQKHRTFLMSFSVLFYSTRTSCIQTEDLMQGTCRVPNPPDNGYIEKTKELYNTSEQVIFKCNNGYVLKGESHRTCTENGTWSKEIQFCSKIISFQRPAFIVKNASKVPDEAAVDGKPDTCVVMDNRWYVRLDKPYKIRSVYLKGNFGHFQVGFKIFVSVLEDEDSNETTTCCEIVGSGMKSIEGEFYCSDRSYLHPGTVVEISSLYKGLHLCEAQIFLEDPIQYRKYENLFQNDLFLLNEVTRERMIHTHKGTFCQNAVIITIASVSLSIILTFIIVGMTCRQKCINKKSTPGKNFFNKQAKEIPLQIVLRNDEIHHKRPLISEKNSSESAVYEEINIPSRSLSSDDSGVDEHGYLIVKSG